MKTTKTLLQSTVMKNPATKIITLPRLIIGVVIICLLFQIQKGKSAESPKYSLPKYVGESIVERVNNHRASLHLRELGLNDSLSAEARRYCETIAKGNLQANLAGVNFAGAMNKHDIDAWDNIKGMQRNMAVFESGSGSPALDAVRTWLDNNNEVANIENPDFTATGIGVVKKGNMYYVCQIFAAKR